ncbi:MAG: histidinol phosphatase [Acidobacteria bacterium]|nr:histidinol phosphatase [Acidobacteriota bacterium]MCW5971422.1 hypothetical protein [Blastocatellales bacterium]
MRNHMIIVLCALALLPIQSRETNLGPGRKYTTVERLQPERLRAVHEDRLRLQRQRREVTLSTGYRDFRAILHAHAEDASHTGGTRPELLAAALRTNVHIIMLTDHVRPQRDFIDDSWRGLRQGVLFIPGAEAEGFLAYPQRSIKNEKFSGREDYIALIKRDGGNIFLSHVEEKADWATGGLDGLEIYNHHSDLLDEREFLRWLREALADPDRLRLLQNALAYYPQEFFGVTQDYLTPIIAKWDRDLQSHPLTGVAANDCHHNQGYIIRVAASDAIEISERVDPGPPRRVTTKQSPRIAELIGDRKPGDVITELDFDPYERSLGYVTTHILARNLTESDVREALRSGRAYVSHDWLADPTGFAFLATRSRSDDPVAVMGGETAHADGLTLRVAAPVAGHIRLLHNGKVITERSAESLDWTVKEPGVYRVEIWLEVDQERRPWIYSNSIRVRPM